MQYVRQRARCVSAARVAVFRRIVECLAHRCDQGFAHLAEAFDLLLRRRERELAPLASVPLDFTRPPAEAGGDLVDHPHRSVIRGHPTLPPRAIPDDDFPANKDTESLAHWNAPVNALGYLRVMFAVDDL